MTTMTDVSGKLGEYMLKGWVLTDSSCPNSGCNIPLMRSPTGRIPITYYCANCDENPTFRGATLGQEQPSPSISSSSYHTRISTPPTEFSSSLSSPTFAPPVETEESLRRRQQSDTASSEIGKRLLKGWAMLAEECPNVRCFGVPLVRPPKVGGGKDPRKECVICGTIYVSENDSNGLERLVPANPVQEAVRKETILSSSSDPETAALLLRDQGETIVLDKLPRAATSATLKHGELGLHLVQNAHSVEPTVQKNTSVSALEVTANSLEQALYTLSARLTFLSGGQSPLDPSSIALTAEAISKVVDALARVKQLHWSENRVSP